MKNVSLLLLVSLGLSCDEHLPPRADPSELLKGDVQASYVLTTSQNLVRLRFTIVNTYDEIIEGTSIIDGQMSLSLIRDPSVTKTFMLSSAELHFARSYNQITGFLTLIPGDSIVFTGDFRFVDDSGRSLREYYPVTDDPNCPGRLVSDREVYMIRAEVDLFPRLTTVIAQPILFDLCHVSVYVEPNVCIPVLSSTSACIP